MKITIDLQIEIDDESTTTSILMDLSEALGKQMGKVFEECNDINKALLVSYTATRLITSHILRLSSEK